MSFGLFDKLFSSSEQRNVKLKKDTLRKLQRLVGEFLDSEGEPLGWVLAKQIKVDPYVSPGLNGIGHTFSMDWETLSIIDGICIDYEKCWIYFWTSVDHKLPLLNGVHVVLYHVGTRMWYHVCATGYRSFQEIWHYIR